MQSQTRAPKSLAWKVIQFPLTRIILAILFVVLVSAGAQAIMRLIRSMLSIPATRTVATGAGAPFPVVPITFDLFTYSVYILAMYGTYWLFVHWIEKRPPTEISLQGAGAELGKGVLIGMGLFIIVIAILWLAGSYQVLGYQLPPLILSALGFAISTGFTEELIFRGILFRIIEEGLGTWIGLTISAAIFGLLHIFNPNATLISSLAIALEAGLMLAATFIYTRRLWLPVGLHLAWNFTQGSIFGVTVSGNPADGLLRSRLVGPELLSGGEFGAEASVVAVVLGLALSIYVIRAAQKKGQILKPFWVKGSG